LHLADALLLSTVPTVDSPEAMFWVMLATMICYMPTLSLGIAVSYNALKQEGLDVVRDYPPIRVWGTLGFFAALWTTSLLQLESSPGQFYIAAAAAVALGLYVFSLPPAPPRLGRGESRALVDVLGLSSFRLFRDRNMA